MALRKKAHRLRWASVGCLLGGLLWLSPAASAQFVGPRASSVALYRQATRLRDSLDAEPARARSEAQYERVLNAYRLVYGRYPQSDQAAVSVYDVARLLAQYGRLFHEPSISQKAIRQNEFLERQYPGSSYRVPALLDQGRIYAYDLKNTAAARTKWRQLIERYPRSPYAGQARNFLAELAESHPSSTQPAIRTAGYASAQEAKPVSLPQNSGFRAEQNSGYRAVQSAPRTVSLNSLPMITSIRHWSTPNYTRVAVNLQQKVEYQAYRVTGSGSIEFNFFGARFAPALNGRSLPVVDNGFLKHIELTEQRDGVARIELDVNPFSEYYAFYLPSPPRLIIDVHGRPAGSPSMQASAAAPSQPQPQIFSRSLPPASQTRAASVTPFARSSTPLEGRPTRAYAQPVDRNDQGLSRSYESVRTTKFRAVEPLRAAEPQPTTEPVASAVSASTAASGALDRTRPSLAASSPSGAEISSGLGGERRVEDRRRTSPSEAARSESAMSELAASAMPAPLVSLRSKVVGHPATVPPLSASNPSLIRALGLKITRVVLDPGHGGHDSGAIGPDGLEEKNVALDVALRLGRLLHQRLGLAVIYTRDNDTFIPLETRTAIANQDHADLFMSIHVNSSPDSSARGVATYYLSFTTSADALELAARENAVSNESIYQLSNLVKKIELSNKISESRAFAEDVQQSLYGSMKQGNGPNFQNRGVRKAPFVVLIGANMPSILTEISFISNPRSEQLLAEPAYRERIAEALYRGVAKYIRTINGDSLNANSPSEDGTSGGGTSGSLHKPSPE